MSALFEHFGGVPARISYDNLATAVRLMVEGRVRREQRQFVAFRSYYLFESHFCQPAAGWEKGGVEASVGFSRRNFLVPIPTVASFEELNLSLLHACLKDDQRRVSRQVETIGQMWERERPVLRSLPPYAYECCVTTSARLNGYSLIVYETNRYSAPVNRARREVIVKAYPFHLDILDGTSLLARHPRSYGREQDLFRAAALLAIVGAAAWCLRLCQAHAAVAQRLARELPSDAAGVAGAVAGRRARCPGVCAGAALT